MPECVHQQRHRKTHGTAGRNAKHEEGEQETSARTNHVGDGRARSVLTTIPFRQRSSRSDCGSRLRLHDPSHSL